MKGLAQVCVEWPSVKTLVHRPEPKNFSTFNLVPQCECDELFSIYSLSLTVVLSATRCYDQKWSFYACFIWFKFESPRKLAQFNKYMNKHEALWLNKQALLHTQRRRQVNLCGSQQRCHLSPCSSLFLPAYSTHCCSRSRETRAAQTSFRTASSFSASWGTAKHQVSYQMSSGLSWDPLSCIHSGEPNLLADLSSLSLEVLRVAHRWLMVDQSHRSLQWNCQIGPTISGKV